MTVLENGAPEHGEHRWGLRGPQAASGPCHFPLLSANPEGGCWGPLNWKNAIMYSDLVLDYTGVWQTLVAFIINSEHLVQSQSWASEMALYAKTVFTKSGNLSSVPGDPLSERRGLTPVSCPMTFLHVYIIKYKMNPVHQNCFLHLYPKLFLTRAKGTGPFAFDNVHWGFCAEKYGLLLSFFCTLGAPRRPQPPLVPSYHRAHSLR